MAKSVSNATYYTIFAAVLTVGLVFFVYHQLILSIKYNAHKDNNSRISHLFTWLSMKLTNKAHRTKSPFKQPIALSKHYPNIGNQSTKWLPLIQSRIERQAEDSDDDDKYVTIEMEKGPQDDSTHIKIGVALLDPKVTIKTCPPNVPRFYSGTMNPVTNSGTTTANKLPINTRKRTEVLQRATQDIPSTTGVAQNIVILLNRPVNRVVGVSSTPGVTRNNILNLLNRPVNQDVSVSSIPGATRDYILKPLNRPVIQIVGVTSILGVTQDKILNLSYRPINRIVGVSSIPVVTRDMLNLSNRPIDRIVGVSSIPGVMRDNILNPLNRPVNQIMGVGLIPGVTHNILNNNPNNRMAGFSSIPGVTWDNILNLSNRPVEHSVGVSSIPGVTWDDILNISNRPDIQLTGTTSIPETTQDNILNLSNRPVNQIADVSIPGILQDSILNLLNRPVNRIADVPSIPVTTWDNILQPVNRIAGGSSILGGILLNAILNQLSRSKITRQVDAGSKFHGHSGEHFKKLLEKFHKAAITQVVVTQPPWTVTIWQPPRTVATWQPPPTAATWLPTIGVSNSFDSHPLLSKFHKSGGGGFGVGHLHGGGDFGVGHLHGGGGLGGHLHKGGGSAGGGSEFFAKFPHLKGFFKYIPKHKGGGRSTSITTPCPPYAILEQ